jgi:hypothetical protein
MPGIMQSMTPASAPDLIRGPARVPLSSLSPQAMGRGTARSAVEGLTESEGPPIMLRMVSLPIRFADRED